jgi:hypothetical protein
MSEGRYRESEIGLPPLFTLRGFEGSLSEYLDALYGQYCAMVYEPGVTLWGKPLSVWGEHAADGRDELFWHIVTNRVHNGGQRRLDLMRCARLCWAASMLSLLSEGDSRVTWWRDSYSRGTGKGRRAVIFVTTVDFRQLIRLDERSRSIMLGTTYPIGHNARPRVMQRAAQSWEAAGPEELRLRQDLAV